MAENKDEGAAKVKARVLVAHHIDGKHHQPNEIYSGSATAVKNLEKQGIVDSDEEAVDYAESLVEPKAK